MNFVWALHFLNSFWYKKFRNTEPLTDLDFIKEFVYKLTERELESGLDELSKSLPIFRSEIYDVVIGLQNGLFDEEAVRALLNGYIVNSTGRRRIIAETGVIQFEPEKVNEAYVLSEIAVAWYIFLFEKDRSRIRVCELPGCECIFIDESKNRSKRHCTDRCSNVMKVRRHREKKNG